MSFPIVYICVSRSCREFPPSSIFDQLPQDKVKFIILKSPTSAANKCCIDFLRRRGNDVSKMKTIRSLRPKKEETQENFADRFSYLDRTINSTIRSMRKNKILLVFGHHREISTLFSYHKLQGLPIITNLDESKLTRRHRQLASERQIHPRRIHRSPFYQQLPCIEFPLTRATSMDLQEFHHLTYLNNRYLNGLYKNPKIVPLEQFRTSFTN